MVWSTKVIDCRACEITPTTVKRVVAGCTKFITCWSTVKGKGKVYPYSLPSVGPGADPGVQAVSPQVT